MSQGHPPGPGWGRPQPGPPPRHGTLPYGTPINHGPPGAVPPHPPQPAPQPPDNYLVWAVLATVFCCFLGGIPALLAATSVNERWQRGDIDGARMASLRARNWTICAVLFGVVFWTVWMVGVFVLGWRDTLGRL